jgi:hypothetical protein
MKHPLTFTLTPQQVATKLADMRYDALADFLNTLAGTLSLQAAGDSVAGRIMLSQELDLAATKIWEAKDHIKEAWKICEPFMKEEK